MKMLIVIGPEERFEDLRALLAGHGVHAYSELPQVLGEGLTGRHMDSHIWPGKSRLIFMVAEDTKIVELEAALKAFEKTLRSAEGVRAFVLPVETVL